MSKPNQSHQVGSDTGSKIGKLAGKAGTKAAKRLARSKAFKKMVRLMMRGLAKVILSIGKALLAYFGPVAFLVGLVLLVFIVIISSIPGGDWFMEAGTRSASEIQRDKEYAEKVKKLSNESIQEIYAIEADQSWLEELASSVRVSWGIPAALSKYELVTQDKFSRDIGLPDPQKFVTELKPVFSYVTVEGDIETVKTVTSCKKTEMVETTRINPDTGEKEIIQVPREKIETTEKVETKNHPQKQLLSSVMSIYGDVSVTHKRIKTDYEYDGSRTEGDCTIKTYSKYEKMVVDDSHSPQLVPDINRLGAIFERFGVNEEDFDMVLSFVKIADPSFPIEKVGGNYAFGDLISGISGYAGVPEEFIEVYKAAAKKFGVDWNYLAAIHWIETSFSSNLKVSYAGAIGHTQFMGCTFVGWSYPGCKGTNGNAPIPVSDLTSLAVIKQYRGYGVDGNADGKADPYDIWDAIFSTANYLKGSGFKSGNESAIYKAVYNYNHADWYVKDVIRRASILIDNPTGLSGDLPPISAGHFTRPALGPITSGFGARWGSFHYGIDIGKPSSNATVGIVAAADGKVVRSYVSTSYGECVIIGHTIKGVYYETLYAHMMKGSRKVTTGDTVKKGQQIGLMGSTGNSTGVHLHFEVHKGGWTSSKSNAVSPVLVVPF